MSEAFQTPMGFTRHESDLLRLLMEAPGIVSRDAIMTRLYTANAKTWPEMKIIDVWAWRIRRKLEARVGEACIETVWGRGLRIDEPAKALIRTITAPSPTRETTETVGAAA